MTVTAKISSDRSIPAANTSQCGSRTAEVTHHPWVLLRTNNVDVSAPTDAPHLRAWRLRDDAERESRECAHVALQELRILGSNENAEEIRKQARKTARVVRLSMTGEVVDPTRIDEICKQSEETLSAAAAAINSWAEAAREYAAADAELITSVEAQLATSREYVAEVLAHDAVRLAAPMSSSSIARSADRYAAEVSNGDGPSRSSRKSEARLVRLAQRALHRVSPYSHYTTVGLAWDASDLEAQTCDGPAAAQDQRHVQADLASLSRLVRNHLAELGADAPIVAARRLPSDADTMRFEVPVDDAAGTSRVFQGANRIATIRQHPVAEAVLAHAERPVSTRQILHELGASSTEGRARLTQLCESLRKVGALSVWNPVRADLHDSLSDTIDRIEDYVAESGNDACAELLSLLRAMREANGDLLVSTPDTRAAALSTVNEVWKSGGIDNGRTVYEDVTSADVTVADPAVFETIRNDLSSLAGVTDIFDNTHLGHGLLHVGLLEQAGGRRVLDFAEFASLVPKILAESNTDRGAMLQRLSDHQPETDLLLQSRIEAADQVRQAGRRGDEEVVWTSEQLNRWQQIVPDGLARDRTSLAWFLQATRTAHGRIDQAVINAVHDGDAQMFSRFLPAWPQRYTDAIRRQLSAEVGTSEVELAPVHGFNANVHPWLLRRAFRTADVDESNWPEVIDPTTLRVVIGDHTIEAIDETGAPIHPHYFGFLVPFLLPPTSAALYMLGRGPLIRMDLGSDIEREESDDAVIVHPRVRFGGVVVTRRAVSMPIDRFPAQHPGEALGHYLARMQDFREEHGLGAHVFLRPEPKAAGLWQQFVAMRTKPLPVDLTDPLHLHVMHAWLADAHRVRITEALPDTHDRPVEPGGTTCATEFVLETVTRRRGALNDSEEIH